MKKILSENIKNDFYTLYQLTLRNLKIFLKDKANVFFSLMAPLIILLLYVLFLGDVQVKNITGYIPAGVSVSEKALKAYVDSWMLSGVLAIACISVSLSANSVMVQDKTRGILRDGMASPVKRGVITAGYFFYNFIVTVIICTFVYFICMIYLAASREWYLSAADVFGIFGVILLSAVSATLITVCICGFLKTEAQHGGFVGIMSAILGFLIGAYMPMSIMPKAAQYISCVIPGSHSAGLFKYFLMTGPLNDLGDYLPPEVTDNMAYAFTMKVNMFGTYVGADIMSVYLAASIILFGVINLAINLKKKK